MLCETGIFGLKFAIQFYDLIGTDVLAVTYSASPHILYGFQTSRSARSRHSLPAVPLTVARTILPLITMVTTAVFGPEPTFDRWQITQSDFPKAAFRAKRSKFGLEQTSLS